MFQSIHSIPKIIGTVYIAPFDTNINHQSDSGRLCVLRLQPTPVLHNERHQSRRASANHWGSVPDTDGNLIGSPVIWYGMDWQSSKSRLAMKETNELSAFCVCTSLRSPLCCSFQVIDVQPNRLIILHFLRGSTSQYRRRLWNFVVSDYGGVGHIHHSGIQRLHQTILKFRQRWKYMEIVGPKFKSFMLYSTGILQVYYRYVRYVLTITEPPCFIRPRWRYPQRGVELEESELLEWMGSSKHIVLGHDCKPWSN